MPSEKQIEAAQIVLGRYHHFASVAAIREALTAAEQAELFEERILTDEECAMLDAAWERHKAAKPKFLPTEDGEFNGNEQAEAATNTLIDTISDEVWNHDASKDNCLVVDSDGLSEAALEPAEPATDVEPVAWRIHAPKDDYYGVGPDTLQFHPLEQCDLEKGYSQTPLYTHPTPSEARLREALEYLQGNLFRMCHADVEQFVDAALKEASE